MNSKSLSLRTREQATNVSPVENSFLPMSMTALSNVRPWDLCMVTAQASLSGTWRHEHCLVVVNQVRRSGAIGTVPSGRVGPA